MAITIAIIGCGTSAVAFIRSFISYFGVHNGLNDTRLILFEPTAMLGVGVAFQEDFEPLLINRPAETMSIYHDQLDMFSKWLKEKKYLSEIHPFSTIYCSRKTFGYYLTETLEVSLREATQMGISVKIIKESVKRIIHLQPFKIETHFNRNFFADYIVLTTGNNVPSDVYQLKNTPKYIHSPYPMYKKLESIKADEIVGVIGNSLTGIDVALSLYHLHHKEKIYLFSRSQLHPRVRSIPTTHQMQFLTKIAIEKILCEKSEVTLRDVLRLFRKELKMHGFDWKFLFVEDDLNKSLIETLEDEIGAAVRVRKWQAVLSATNKIIELVWNALSYSSKKIFIEMYQRIWLRNRSPIPVSNASQLLDLAKEGKLDMISGLQQLKYDKNLHKYIALTQRGKMFSLDWVINATGPSRHVQPEDELMYQLIQNGIGREQIFGGLDVDFNTAALINVKGHINPCIRLLGHNTTGVYGYTSSVEMIAKKADIIAYDLIQTIKRNNTYAQNQMVNTTSTHCSGNIA